jgi:uncharacterized cupredoxin-like copper-binding protein
MTEGRRIPRSRWSAPTAGALAVVAGLLLATLAACGGGSGAAAQPAGSTKVSMSEFEFTPHAVAVKSGATLFLVNDGSVAHDLVVADSGGAVKAKSSLVQPGNSATLTLNDLPAGDYRLSCDVPGHKEAGMVGTLTVT